jgi:hypothetical protein
VKDAVGDMYESRLKKSGDLKQWLTSDISLLNLVDKECGDCDEDELTTFIYSVQKIPCIFKPGLKYLLKEIRVRI